MSDPGWEVLGVRVCPHPRRQPLAHVEVRFGELVVTFGFARMRRGRWEVRPPCDPYGEPAVKLPGEVQAAVAAAIRARVEHDLVWRAELAGWGVE